MFLSFFAVVLTSLLNTNKEKVQKAGAACAGIRLQALQYNKRRERDSLSLGNIMTNEEFSIEIVPVHQQHGAAHTVQQLQPSLAPAPEGVRNTPE